MQDVKVWRGLKVAQKRILNIANICKHNTQYSNMIIIGLLARGTKAQTKKKLKENGDIPIS